MKIKVTQVKWYSGELKEAERKEGKIAMLKLAENVLEEANKDVPHDEGILMTSGDTSADETAKGITAHVSYDTPYAKRLHENPQYNFNEGRKGKWLEDVINRMRADGSAIKFLKDGYAHLFKGL